MTKQLFTATIHGVVRGLHGEMKDLSATGTGFTVKQAYGKAVELAWRGTSPYYGHLGEYIGYDICPMWHLHLTHGVRGIHNGPVGPAR